MKVLNPSTAHAATQIDEQPPAPAEVAPGLRLRTNASSLFTAMKSVFSSFGVAILATVVQTQTTVHSAVLAWQVRADTPRGAALGSASGRLQVQAGLTPAAADLAAVGLAAGRLAQEGAVLAFSDAYGLTFLAALIALLLSTLLPGRSGVEVDRAAMAAG